MLNNLHHIGVFRGNGEQEGLEIENMFFELFNHLPGVVFLDTENETIVGVKKPIHAQRCTNMTRENA